jgi:hypothetical protein
MDQNRYDWMPIEYLEDVALQVLQEEREKIQAIARRASRLRDERLEKGEARKKPAWNLAKEKATFRRRLFGGA